MGNCLPKTKRRPRSSKTIAESSPAAVQLIGLGTCPITCRIRVALLYKGVIVDLVETGAYAGAPFLRCGSEKVAGSEESLLRYIDKRFGGPQAAAPTVSEQWEGRNTAAEVVTMQHRSIRRHVEGMARWASKIEEESGGVGGVNVSAAEGRRLGKWYGDLVEIMLEHAQMEERLLFPAFARTADDGKPPVANQQHGRDLPIINGIKEDLKSMMAMNADGPLYKEAALNLSLRFKVLQEHCKQHFDEEERVLLPLLVDSERVRREEREEPWPPSRWVEQVAALTEATHSRLFAFFATGLLPFEALQYVRLVAGGDERRAVTMLRSLAGAIETSPWHSWLREIGLH
ncbi:hypothetical protein HPP92_025137 [Vanilla planifolia]|uniref:Hemerythrin-like domain-containing protein n=1 Tax=Vanilla planifolia TaxID=51239 RepID=A0A835PGZ8_VANPL|nr:hypothetical protein HPP92_025137 [Vanilla planifolia]